MRARPISKVIAAAALTFTIFGCGATDSPVAPPLQRPTPTGPEARHTLLGSPETVVPVLRDSALPSPITVSKTIGILGGTISIPSAGLTVVVPALALATSQTISVTAVVGSKVAYEFSPHGLTFNVPLVMTQDLTHTQAKPGGVLNALNLFVGYFPNSASPTSVTEELGVSLTLQHTAAVTTLWHFSGYILAGGRDNAAEY